MAKLLKMLWEYMNLTVLPFFETWSAHIFGGWQRVCWCTNEAFNQASPTKEIWENCPQKKGGHIYGKNEGGGGITEMTVHLWKKKWQILGLDRKVLVLGNSTDSTFGSIFPSPVTSKRLKTVPMNLVSKNWYENSLLSAMMLYVDEPGCDYHQSKMNFKLSTSNKSSEIYHKR